ncbi:MAG TPA: ion transporter [Bacteroidia bacterium]|nr:ion transporter [Bacteroidia bacterium]
MATMYSTIKKRIFILLDPAEGGSLWDKFIDSFIVTLIVLNVLAVMLETVDSLFIEYGLIFRQFEVFSVGVFTLEYALRVWTCTFLENYKHPIVGRVKYIMSIGSLIDLIAIAPFFMPFTKIYDFRFVRIFRLLRFLRVFKLGRYLNATKVVSNVLKEKKEELVLCLIITITLIVVASSFMYFVEHDAQPIKFSSIPETMWWSVTTLTTVGYGDVIPITGLGRVLTSCISILGIGMFALPAGILASGFSAEFQKLKKHKNVCPHCGKVLNDNN